MQRATALSVAGSDSGGGAGIQADLAAFSHFGVFGTVALTAVTAQNPHGVRGIASIEPSMVCAQIDAVMEDFAVASVKTGMLYRADTIRAVADAMRRHRPGVLVVDPVMVATSGARLLEPDAVEALCDALLPLATLITPNLPEAAVLLGRERLGAEAVGEAAEFLARRFGAAVLVKGGHGTGAEAWDCLCDGGGCRFLVAPRVEAASTHGTGCSLSAALAACLAKGEELVEAARQAKAYVLARLRRCGRVGPNAWAMGPAGVLPLADIRIETGFGNGRQEQHGTHGRQR
ncbi:MAG: bifunctional hydroxymethylpyrimidine kinase/phosphomethylpyrimidine kinase [Lentisphaeria bacterium]|nr:bifunctional hydroxymethylpyrimidine kinase/phosphomethylpyrimidine kinase [Lentisphaeria bacterium]